MRNYCLIVLLLCAVGSASSQEGFLTNSSRYIGGPNFQHLPPVLLVALEKSSIEIPCSSTQNNVKVSWIKEKGGKNTQFKVLETGSLYINQVKLSDEGSFRCMLTNKDEYTISSHSVSIKVVNFMNFWEMDSSFNITTVGNSVIRLPCAVKKHDAPPPYGYKLSWTKSSKEVTTNNRIILLHNGALIIKKTHKSDSGIYRCKATFGYGAIESPGHSVKISADLSNNFVKEPDEKVYLRPSPSLWILNTPMVVNAVEGHFAVLECITNDLNLEPYHWERHDGVPISKGVEVISGGFLHFEHVAVEDSGVYICKSSQVKIPELRPVRLVVLLPPAIVFSKPDSLSSGPHVRFNCTATGRPQPSIEILKDGFPLHKDFNYDITGPVQIMANTVSYSLHISYIWRKDEGIYQCMARNKAGVASKLMALKIGKIRNVSPPSNVSVSNFTSSSIHYQWMEPKSIDLITEFRGFIVYFFPTDKNENVTELVLREAELDKEYTDLLPDKNYTFIIRVFQIQKNNTNISDPVHVYQKTKAERPLHGPDVYFSLKKDSIQVRWTPLPYKKAGGEIIKQKIQWKREGDVTYSEKILNPSATKFVIKERDPSSIYLIRVLVSTSAGYPLQHQNWIEVGAKKRLSSRVEEWPNPIVVELCLKSNKYSNILISWNYYANLDNENFNIEIFGINSEARLFTVQAFKRRLLVEELKGGCYTVQLTGDSEYSQYVEAEALICTIIPEKEVHDLEYRLYSSEVTDFTSDMISINWVANVYKYFIIEVSSVEFLPKSFEQDKDYNSLENSIFFTNDNAAYQVFHVSILIVTCQSANLTLLYPATTYRIRIIAANEHIKGIPSSPLFVTTQEGVPSNPINYNVDVLTTSSVNVSWQDPIDVNGYLMRYEISYSSDKAAWKTAITTPNTHYVVLHGLLSNTCYYVRIVASTIVGSGEVLEGVIFIPAELRQSISPHMIAVCVISVFVFSTCLVLTYLCTKMYRMRKSSSYGERDSNSSNTVNEHSIEGQKGQVEDHAMIENSSSSSSQQFANNVEVTRSDFKRYGSSGCKKYVPSNYKESSLTLLQKRKSEHNSEK